MSNKHTAQFIGGLFLATFLPFLALLSTPKFKRGAISSLSRAAFGGYRDMELPYAAPPSFTTVFDPNAPYTPQNFNEEIMRQLTAFHRKFTTDIKNGLNSKQAFDQLISQLPFEPDNFRTGDCIFSASFCVLALNELWQSIEESSQPNTRLIDILADIATCTHIMHSTRRFKDFLSKIKKQYNTQPPPSLDQLATDFSSCREFKNYKKNILDGMKDYINQFDQTNTINITENTASSANAPDFNVQYIAFPQAVYGQVKLVHLVKQRTRRLIILERKFGQLDNGGELGTIKVLSRLRNISNTNFQIDEGYNEYPCKYIREDPNNPLSKIKVQYLNKVNIPDGPTLILQIASVDLDAEILKFLPRFESSNRAAMVIHYINSLARKPELTYERSENHVITASVSVVFNGENLWFTADKGLSFP